MNKIFISGKIIDRSFSYKRTLLYLDNEVNVDKVSIIITFDTEKMIGDLLMISIGDFIIAEGKICTKKIIDGDSTDGRTIPVIFVNASNIILL